MAIQSGLPTVIKSIQIVYVNYTGGSGSKTITAVNTERTALIPHGVPIGVNFYFTNSTTINVQGATGTGSAYVQIVEFA